MEIFFLEKKNINIEYLAENLYSDLNVLVFKKAFSDFYTFLLVNYRKNNILPKFIFLKILFFLKYYFSLL